MEVRAPRGFRDYLPDVADRREKIAQSMGACLKSAGYGLIETPVLECLDVLQMGGRASADSAFRFVDIDGRLVALRSDLTVPVARMVATRFTDIEAPYRLRYNAEVYREQEQLRGQPRQVTQIGIELIGDQTVTADIEVLQLAIRGLKAAGLKSFKLHINDVSIFRALTHCASSDQKWLDAIHQSAISGDMIEIRQLAQRIETDVADLLTDLPMLCGGIDTLHHVKDLIAPLCPDAIPAVERLIEIGKVLSNDDCGQHIMFDFSVMSEFSYYTGLVFDIYAPFFGLELGSGGRYDKVLADFGRDLPAAGFAYDLDRVEEVLSQNANRGVPNQKLRIAIPKGSLYSDSLALLGAGGLDVRKLADPGRHLTIETDQAIFVISKPTDVAIYVSTGAVDCGIGGRDILVEADFDLLELVDLQFGACQFVVAAPNSDKRTLAHRALEQGIIRVATKYPRLTQQFFDQLGIQIELVKLNGNIEIAPIIGVSDVIVDITATGTTLVENDLGILEYVTESSARFVANVASARTRPEVYELANKMQELVGDTSTDAS